MMRMNGLGFEVVFLALAAYVSPLARIAVKERSWM